MKFSPAPVASLPVSSIFLGQEGGKDDHGKTGREGAAFLQPLLCQHCSCSTVGRTSRAMLCLTPHGHQHELPTQWLGLHHPGTARIWGMLQHFQGSSADRSSLTVYIWAFRHLQNLISWADVKVLEVGGVGLVILGFRAFLNMQSCWLFCHSCQMKVQKAKAF